MRPGGLHRRPGPRRSARRSLSTPPWSIPRERQSCDELKASSICRAPRIVKVGRARVDSGWAIRYPRCGHAASGLLACARRWPSRRCRPGARTPCRSGVEPPPPPPSPNRFSVLPEQWQQRRPAERGARRAAAGHPRRRDAAGHAPGGDRARPREQSRHRGQAARAGARRAGRPRGAVAVRSGRRRPAAQYTQSITPERERPRRDADHRA